MLSFCIKPGFLFLWFTSLSLCLVGQQSDLSKNVVALSHKVVENHIQNRLSLNQIEEVDTLYKQALAQCGGNVSEALLALTFTCLPYQSFAMRIPIIKLKLLYPLYSADTMTFLRKNSLLVNNVYFDSPKSKFGDRDKLAHFFGAAFLGYVTNTKCIPNFIGCFVEMFEEAFKVDDQVDLRDVRTNNLGGILGEHLRKNSNINPSMYFSFYNLTNMIR
jgi:hypothetical protein